MKTGFADIDALLAEFSFDEERFQRQQAFLQTERFSPDLARVRQPVSAPDASAVTHFPARDSGAFRDLYERGKQALARGEVAVFLLNGGMATRFGGIAKGAAHALGAHSFLALRIGQVQRMARELSTRVPVVLMNSFATAQATREHLAKHQRFDVPADDLFECLQGISLRLCEDGSLFLGDDGKPSCYAPGHGDVPWALQHSGVADKLRARGVKTLFISNVDNLGCMLDPAVIGAHLSASVPMTDELVERYPGDVGGSPALVDGKLQLVEGFRLPKNYEPSAHVGFSTNTFCAEWSALDPQLPLGFYAVGKKVDGRTAVQFERILGEVTKFVPTQYLTVPRDAEQGRFLPVKTPEDLATMQDLLHRRYGC